MILVAAERACDFPRCLPRAANRGPADIIDTGESVETPLLSQTAPSGALRVAQAKAFAVPGASHKDVDHLMIYDVAN